MIDLKKIAEEIAIGKAGSVESWLLPIADIEQMIELIHKQEGELSAARKANDILLEQSNAQIGEIYALETKLAKQEATIKESLNVAGELPELPWGDDFEAWIEVRGTNEVAAEFKAYAATAIAAARPAIWYEGCDTALANKVAEETGGAAPAVDLSGLTVYEFRKFDSWAPSCFYEASDVRALLAAAPVAPALLEEFSELASQLESDAQCYDGQLAEEALSCAHSMQRLIADAGADTPSAQHDSDCSTHNAGVPALLGPCDCSAAPSCPLTQAQIDHIGEQWDGCMYDAGDGRIDIGACLRRELALLANIGGVK